MIRCASLLSLLPPSCMVAPIRELANTLNPFTPKLQENQPELYNYYSMDTEIDMPRGCSASLSSRGISPNSTVSSMDYVEQVQAMSKNLTWAEQVENGEVESLSLSYVTVKEAMTDITSMEPAVKPMHVSHATDINNTSIP